MAPQIQKRWWLSLRKTKIYLETKFCPNPRILVFWRPFFIQNGNHSKPKWSSYGVACLTPCKYPFPLKYFYFWIFNNLFWFYIGSHFEMVAILNILKTKSTTLSDDQKDPLYCVNLKNFAPWLPWHRPPFWIFSTPQKLLHTTMDIPTKFHEVWWKVSKIILNLPFFVSMATEKKFVQPIQIFLAYLVPLTVDVVPIKLHQFLFGE